MQIRFLTRLSELEQISDEWMELYRACGRSPFQNPELHRVWWQYLGLREGWSPFIALGYQKRRLIAVASFSIKRSRLLRTLEWAGTAAFDYPELLLAEGVDAAPLWQAVRRSGCYDVARLRWVRSDAIGRQPLLGFARKVGEDHPVHAIELGYRNGEDWLNSLPRSMRSEHREKLRQLAKLGPVTMRRATQSAEIADAVRTLVRFKVEWSQTRGAEAVYVSDEMKPYFEELALAALRDQTLHLTTLDCGGQSLAAHLGFASQDGFYYYLSAYDIAAAKLSPGRVHMNLMVMWAIDNGLPRFDFLRGEADYKSRLGPISRQLEDYTFARGLFGTAALQAYLWHQNGRAASIASNHQARSAGSTTSSPPAL